MNHESEARNRLLVAATELFSERGYAAASVRAIAARAGVNLGAVSYHFGGKRQLYRAVLRNAVQAVFAPLAEDPPEDAAKLAHRLGPLLDTGSPPVRLLLQDLASGGELTLEAAAPYLRQAIERSPESLAGAEPPHGSTSASRIVLASAIAPLLGAALLWPVLRSGFGMTSDDRLELLERLATPRDDP